MESLINLWQDTGFYQMTIGQFFMISIGCLLLFLAIHPKFQFEPLLLLPIAIGTIFVNIPGADFYAPAVYAADGHLDSPAGLLYYIYHAGIETGLFPLMIFMGVGAMTDFGPLLANPKTLLLGAAAQFGIFGTVAGAVLATDAGYMDFTIQQAAAIGIIGGADGPTDRKSVV